jgi:YARHG domain
VIDLLNGGQKMRIQIHLGFLTFFSLVSAGPALAGDAPEHWNCQQLWTARNQIYKDGGYCFVTQRAVRRFGNAGCDYDDVSDVPLSANQRREVAEIVKYERAKRCPR